MELYIYILKKKKGLLLLAIFKDFQVEDFTYEVY